MPVGAEDAEGLKVTVKMRLTKEGEIDGTPEVSGSGGSTRFNGCRNESARRAVMQCAPFTCHKTSTTPGRR